DSSLCPHSQARCWKICTRHMTESLSLWLLSALQGGPSNDRSFNTVGIFWRRWLRARRITGGQSRSSAPSQECLCCRRCAGRTGARRLNAAVIQLLGLFLLVWLAVVA